MIKTNKLKHLMLQEMIDKVTHRAPHLLSLRLIYLITSSKSNHIWSCEVFLLTEIDTLFTLREPSECDWLRLAAHGDSSIFNDRQRWIKRRHCRAIRHDNDSLRCFVYNFEAHFDEACFLSFAIFSISHRTRSKNAT